MSSLFLRGALLSAGALVAATAPAQASPVLLGSPAAVTDASSDGRYVLLDDGVLDRTTSTTLPLGAGTPVALADRAPRVLVNTGTGLVVRDLATGTEQVANVDPSGATVAPSQFIAAELVDNGRVVVFTTGEATPRIIERNLATETSTVRLTGATQLDVSEDGQIVTYRRELASVTRPAGVTPAPNTPSSVGGTAVGYQQRGQAPRIVERSTWTQKLVPNPGVSTCSERRAEETTTTPWALQISQNGAGKYALYVTRTRALGPAWGYSSVITDRVTETGTILLTDSGNPSVRDDFQADPVSGAYTLIHTTHGAMNRWNVATLVSQDGTGRTLRVLPVTGPGGTFDESSLTVEALPINGGAGVVYRAAPNTADQFLGRPNIYIDEAGPAGPSVGTPWLTLPRPGDVVDTAEVRPDVTWADCGLVAAPATIADYAALTLRTTGNSAGSVAVTIAPAGKAKAKSVTATVSWLGLPFSVRRVTTDTTIKLPGIPVGIGGFKLTLVATLDNGQTVRSGTALRRTR